MEEQYNSTPPQTYAKSLLYTFHPLSIFYHVTALLYLLYYKYTTLQLFQKRITYRITFVL